MGVLVQPVRMAYFHWPAEKLELASSLKIMEGFRAR